MRFNYLKATLKTAVLAVSVLLLGAGVAVAQVNLTAQPTSTTLPDGTVVPMWATVAAQSLRRDLLPLKSERPARDHHYAGRLVPRRDYRSHGQVLTINLTNSLSFGANSVPHHW